jgi:hypothetical protein
MTIEWQTPQNKRYFKKKIKDLDGKSKVPKSSTIFFVNWSRNHKVMAT